MDDPIIVDIARRLDINDDDVIKKATEFKRFLAMQTRKENVGEQSESVFCLHIAAGLLIGSEFNQPECLKLTNQGQTKYNRTKRSIEKMLKIEKNLSIKDICISMSLGEAVQNYAVKLLQKYTETNNRDVDTSLPQYTAMAVCQAVKQLKIVMRNKKRLVALSYLTARKWNEFDQQWMKLGLKVDDNGAEQNVENAETIDENVKENVHVSSAEEKAVESYADWRERILAKAYADREIKNKIKKLSFIGDGEK